MEYPRNPSTPTQAIGRLWRLGSPTDESRLMEKRVNILAAEGELPKELTGQHRLIAAHEILRVHLGLAVSQEHVSKRHPLLGPLDALRAFSRIIHDGIIAAPETEDENANARVIFDTGDNVQRHPGEPPVGYETKLETTITQETLIQVRQSELDSIPHSAIGIHFSSSDPIWPISSSIHLQHALTADQWLSTAISPKHQLRHESTNSTFEKNEIDYYAPDTVKMDLAKCALDRVKLPRKKMQDQKRISSDVLAGC
ncbi:hypothetical protein PT974_01474 [Cladobotryum mycophilum]|uniref:Uncharacterized protein n=1 Tax=Cladobotryum mycophilum TaxID=491253 RepID=A0ABR0T3S2_9HYPO